MSDAYEYRVPVVRCHCGDSRDGAMDHPSVAAPSVGGRVVRLRRAGVDLVFLNHPLGQGPEDDLLLQVQGVVAEYERAKILERSRRGKLHAARRGSVNVLSQAPYGYRNPAYKGMAGFGKRRIGPRLPRNRPQRNGREQPRRAVSWHRTPPERWTSIPVPAIVEEELFEAVQEQLRENQQRPRLAKVGEATG